MRTALTLVGLLVALALPSGAAAHLVTQPKGDSLAHREASQQTNLDHVRYVARHGAGATRRWHRAWWPILVRELRETQRARAAARLDSLSPVALGRYLAAQRGWTGAEWNCLHHLWGPLEGGWYVYADNPTSDAYGIPQALPGSKMGEGWQHSALVQIRWGLGYIARRYGSPCAARSFRLSRGWY